MMWLKVLQMPIETYQSYIEYYILNKNLKEEENKNKKLFEIGIKNSSELNSESEINKWIMERKRRFPKSQNQEPEIKNPNPGNISILEKKLRNYIDLINNDSYNIKKENNNKRLLLNFSTKIRKKKLIDKPIEVSASKEITENNREKIEVKKVKDHTIDEIIGHLKNKQNEDDDKLKEFLKKNPKNYNYKYIQNTLFANLVLDDILKERNNIFDMIEYLCSNNFLN